MLWSGIEPMTSYSLKRTLYQATRAGLKLEIKWTRHSLNDKWTCPINKDSRIHQAQKGWQTNPLTSHEPSLCELQLVFIIWGHFLYINERTAASLWYLVCKSYKNKGCSTIFDKSTWVIQWKFWLGFIIWGNCLYVSKRSAASLWYLVCKSYKNKGCSTIFDKSTWVIQWKFWLGFIVWGNCLYVSKRSAASLWYLVCKSYKNKGCSTVFDKSKDYLIKVLTWLYHLRKLSLRQWKDCHFLLIAHL